MNRGDSMFRRLLILTTLGVLLSGCYMVPMALVGPATSGFTTASLVQASISTSANYIIKQKTGKTISEHAFDSISKEVLQQSYLPKSSQEKVVVTPTHF